MSSGENRDFPAGSGPQQEERFARLAELKGNWDSYGGLPIDAAAMERAKAWLRNAAVVPCSDGGVQLEWHSEGCDVEIVFRADGTTEAFAEEIGSRGPTPEGERRTGQRDVEQMRDDLHRLGMLALQSDRYQTDGEYREATDAALEWHKWGTQPAGDPE